ncbi:hypothetical protein F5Y12DRAFT_763195 [Xylaria sp. FL1777]|nr:hypothetical protein F5Y12DRAFT_763195 [Xylaria sp. FL1777]
MSLRRATSPKRVDETQVEPKVTSEPPSIMYPQQARSHQPSSHQSHSLQPHLLQANQSHASVPPTAVYKSKQLCVPLGMSILKALREVRTNPYIHQKDWGNLHISCSELDINSSTAHGNKYFNIVSAQQMQKFAQEHNFRRFKDLGPLNYSQNYSTAHMLTSHVGEYFMTVHNDTFLSERLGWFDRRPDEYEKHKLRYYPKGDLSWQVELLLEPTNKSLPHVTCTLIDDHLHKEDSLLFSEVWCIVMLTLIALRLAKNEKHNVVPVTLVSFSHRQYRIVQGFMDGKKGIVNIWKSRIIHSDKMGKVQEEMKGILRWLLATPVGDTTKTP